MSRRGEKTDEPGIYRLDDGRYRVLATAKDPETGRMRQRQRTLPKGQLMEDAIEVRESLKADIRGIRDAEIRVRTLTDFADRWTDRKRRSTKPSTAATYERILGNHVLPIRVTVDGELRELGELALSELGRQHVLQWVDWASTATPTHGSESWYATATVRKWWRHFRPLLRDLHAAGHTDRDLTVRVDPPTTPIRDVRETEAIPHETLREVARCARDTIPERYAEIAVLAYTGMRSCELWALHWQDIDHDGGVIHVRRSVSDGQVTESTKTGVDRKVPMLGPVEDALTFHRQRGRSADVERLRRGLCFPATTGRPRTPGSLRHAFRKIERQLGLDVRIRPQLIRKSVVTALRNAGVGQKAARALVGHSTEAMQSHYFSANAETRRLLDPLAGGDTS